VQKISNSQKNIYTLFLRLVLLLKFTKIDNKLILKKNATSNFNLLADSPILSELIESDVLMFRTIEEISGFPIKSERTIEPAWVFSKKLL
jgi:hypothetical protein